MLKRILSHTNCSGQRNSLILGLYEVLSFISFIFMNKPVAWITFFCRLEENLFFDYTSTVQKLLLLGLYYFHFLCVHIHTHTYTLHV